MTTSFTSRLETAPEEGVKAPCVASTTVDITLSGTQTIDGVAVVAADRVLVRSQTDSAENGIYDVSSGAWVRSTDFNGPTDLINGNLVPDANSEILYQANFTGSYEPGVTLVSFSEQVAASVTTHMASTAEHGATGAVVGTTNTQTLTNKTIVALNNIITTAAAGNLTATELNAALAELDGQDTAIRTDLDYLSVTTVAAMKALSIAAGETVITQGYYSAGDGGGAAYLVVAPQAANNLIDHDLANSNVAVVQYSSRFNVKWAGAKGDDSNNDTLSLESAIGETKGAGVGTELYLPTGIYQFSETTTDFGLYINQPIKVIGDGAEKTVLKNISATGAGLRCAGGFMTLQDFTIDNNGSTGIAYRHGGQFSNSANLTIKNQTGSEYACVVDGTTLCSLDDIRIFNCSNGLQLAPTIPTQFIRSINMTIEVTEGGRFFDIGTCSKCRFDSFSMEPATGTVELDKIGHIEGASELEINGFSLEMASDVVNAENAWIEIVDSHSVFIDQVRIIEHQANAPSTSIFKMTGTGNRNITFKGFELITLSTGLSLFHNAGTLLNLSIEDILTINGNVATGINLAASVSGNFFAKNWVDTNAASSHAIDAVQSLVINNSGDMAVVDRDNQAFINCPGTFSGTGATIATRINSGAGCIELPIGGVKFPATQVPSSDANTLDDYQEGTWTPVLQDGSANAATITSQAFYTKIGRMVHVKARIAVSSLGAMSGPVQINGLPFTSNSFVNSLSTVTFATAAGIVITAGNYLTGYIVHNSSIIYPLVWDLTSGTSDLTAANLTASASFVLDATYYA